MARPMPVPKGLARDITELAKRFRSAQQVAKERHEAIGFAEHRWQGVNA